VIEATLTSVPGGWLLNGRLFLADLCQTPEGRRAVRDLAAQLSDEIDRRVFEKVYAQVCRTLPEGTKA